MRFGSAQPPSTDDMRTASLGEGVPEEMKSSATLSLRFIAWMDALDIPSIFLYQANQVQISNDRCSHSVNTTRGELYRLAVYESEKLDLLDSDTSKDPSLGFCTLIL